MSVAVGTLVGFIIGFACGVVGTWYVLKREVDYPGD